MSRLTAALVAAFLLAGCAGTGHPSLPAAHVPPFVSAGYEPFSRDDAVAIALREWRLFGQPIEPDVGARPPAPHPKAERQPGLWQRVGEYWWIGQNGTSQTVGWTGKHDAHGALFPPEDDAAFAWSAAFISYVMRLAGAGERFPYAPDHATYVNAAAAGRSPILKALPLDRYAPRRGDLVCFGRASARGLRFEDLPTDTPWPGHCALVVAHDPRVLSVIGGNVDDAVSLTHIPVTDDGLLADPDGAVIDRRHAWFVALQVQYDADAEPAADR